MNFKDFISSNNAGRVLEPYFKSEDMKYCSVPVPLIDAHKENGAEFEYTEDQKAKYGQSQTHPSIVYIPEGLGGHKWWLAATPYPNSTGIFENPCIYYGDEDENGNPPLIFHPINGTASGEYTMTTNPIVRVSKVTDTNSDPDIFYNPTTKKLGLISRLNTNSAAYYYQESIDGQSWTHRPDEENYIIKTGDGMDTGLVSPSVIVKDNINTMYALAGAFQLSSNNRGMYMYRGAFEKNMPNIGKASILGKMDIQPWHSDICFYNNKYYMLFCAFNNITGVWGALHLAESTDGLDFRIFARPISDSAFYRPSLYIADDKIVIYAALDGGASKDASLYPRGESDVPVDGRAIVRIVGSFSELIKILSNDLVTN